jgi:putative transposase
MEILTSARKTKLKTALLRNLAAEVLGIFHPVDVISVFILSDFLRPVLLHPVQDAICLELRQAEPADLQRKVTFRMYPCATEIRALNKSAIAHCKIYNTLLEVSRLRHKAGLPAFTRTTVCDAVKAIRNTHAWIEEATTAQSVQVTGQRLVRAFENFFARVAKGQTPGYPRFKSSKRYPGWGYKTYGDGWSLLEQKSKTNSKGKMKHGYSAVRISGVGNVQIRGAARFLGIPKTAEVIRKNEKWHLSVTVDVAHASIARQAGHASMAFDWGVNTLLTQVVGDPMTGTVEEVENPRWLKKQLTLIARVQRFIAEMETAAKKSSGKDKRFPVCHLLKNAYARRRSIHKRIAAQRHDFYHQLTAKLIEQFGLIVTEELAIKNMTKAPKPKEDPDQPGQYLPNGAAAKGGLNRSILDSAPGMLLAQLNYKASEADGRLQFIPTKKVKPTQRCHICGVTTKLTLKERQWTCTCGAHHQRDVNAPRTMLRYAYEGA